MNKSKITLLLLLFSLFSLAAEPPHQPEKSKFRFLINADPQMGGEKTDKKGLKILNQLLEGFVSDVNEMNQHKPVDFVVYNGDLVWDPYQDAFDNFTRIVGSQEVPSVLVHGNHDGYNKDPKFLQAQKKLSGYEKLNYSFAYGQWQFIVIAAQEKYLDEDKKKKQLEWMENELAKYKDKKVMLLMHYHIMPVGLSQMEFYTYWPMSFKNQMLGIITKYNNVKYVYSGHVHSGIKASVKSSLEYKGIKFINCPTPVFSRPFGEEYQEFENENDMFFRRGFYLEVRVDGDDVELIGRKIKNKHSIHYPKQLKQFKVQMDPRFFVPESQSRANKTLKNNSFDDGFRGWKKSYRYKKDKKNSFKNSVKNGANKLSLTAPWGSWSFDEYMETYQLLEFDLQQNNILSYEFDTPKYDKRGAGGYIRIFFYDKQQKRNKKILLHWGHKEERVKMMYQSWFYNSDGNRASTKYINNQIDAKEMLSLPIRFDSGETQLLDIDLNKIVESLNAGKPESYQQAEIGHISIAHGVWTRVTRRGVPFKSKLTVKNVSLSHSAETDLSIMMLNNKKLKMSDADKKIPYYQF